MMVSRAVAEDREPPGTPHAPLTRTLSDEGWELVSIVTLADARDGLAWQLAADPRTSGEVSR